MGRVISYGEKTGYNDGDYLLMDNGDGGTKRIRADRVGPQVDSVPIEGSNNAVSSGGVYEALVGKVAKPLTSPNGTNGQLLRTLGNGQTQWTDFGLPTDAQVIEIFGDWLDDHPEATTTVQDGVVTESKIASSLKNKLALYFETIQDLKTNTALASGMIVRTLGYYAINDGGDSLYRIRAYNSVTDVDDGGSILFIGTSEPPALVAELIIENDYVSVKQFGAYGIDESINANADDTPMIKKAIEFGINNGYRVYFPKGTYICDSYTKNTGDYMWFKIDTGQSMHLFGEGRDSVIKRKSDSLIYSATSTGHNVLIRIGPPNYSANTEYYPNSVTIESLTFDGNKRGQSDIETGGNYENSPVLYFHSNGAPRGHNNFESCRLENLYFYDPIADNIAFSGGHGSYKTTYITNVFCTGRTGIRHDFDFVAVPIGNIHMTNIVCDSIHGEYLSGYDTGLTPTDYIMDGVKTRDLTFAGLSIIKASHVYVGEYLHLGRLVEGIFNDCVFNLVSNNNTLLSVLNGNIPIFRFNHCKFIINDLTEGTGTSHLYLYKRFDVLFDHCEFINNASLTLDTDGDNIADHNTAIPIKIERTTNMTLQKTVFDGCDFDISFYQTIQCNGGCGVVKFKNMSIGTYIGVPMLGTVGNDVCDEEFIDVIFNRNCKSFGEYRASTANCKIYGNIICYDSNARAVISGAQSPVSVVQDLKRTIYIDEPLTKTKFRLTTSILLRTDNVITNIGTSYRYGRLLPQDEFIYLVANRQTTHYKWKSVYDEFGYDGNGQTDGGQIGGKDLVVTDGIPVLASAPSYMYGAGSQYIESGGDLKTWNGSAWV